MDTTQFEQDAQMQREPSYSFEAKRERFLKKAFQKLFTPLRRFLKGIEDDFADRTPGKKALIAIYKMRKPLLLTLVLVLIAAGCLFARQSVQTASVEMSLNYEESAKGLKPNSTRFNVYDVASPEVIENMLAYCGIDPQSVDIASITDCISISPTNKKAFSADNLYISTTYRITMRKPDCLSRMRIEDLLHFLCKAYKDNLYSKYTENRSILSFDIEQFHEEEYLEIANLLDLKSQQLEKYLSTRAKQSKTFTEQESDETFKSLLQKAENIRNYDIAKYRVFVTEAGVSYDKPRYLRSLDYIDRMNNLSYSKDIMAYNVYNEGIRLYNKEMIDVVMIPSIDTAKRTYYMSKTKTGMDYMAKTADDYLLTAQDTLKQMQSNEDVMRKLSAGANKKSDIQKADLMIEEIERKLSELSEQVETVDKAYIKHKTKDYLTFKDVGRSLMQKLQVRSLAVIALVMMLGIYALLWLRFRRFGGGGKK